MSLIEKLKKIFTEPENKNEITEKFNKGWEYYITANELFELKKFEEALSYYDLAVKYSVKRAYSERGWTLQSLGYSYDAIEDFNLAIADYPVDANLYFGRACALMSLKEYDNAESDLRKAISLSKEDNEMNRLRDEKIKEIKWNSSTQLYQSQLDFCLQMISTFNDMPDVKKAFLTNLEIKKREVLNK